MENINKPKLLYNACLVKTIVTPSYIKTSKKGKKHLVPLVIT